LAIRLFRQQVSGCAAIDKENIFQDPGRESSGTGRKGLSLSVSYGRYSSVTRYRLMPKALLRSMISGGILGRYFLLKLVSPK